MDFAKLRSQGGAAFPQPMHHPDLEVFADSGMSLRDYLAGKALAGVLSNRELCGLTSDATAVATVAYEMADAMLRERRKA